VLLAMDREQVLTLQELARRMARPGRKVVS
jgi:hypothetical protein